MAKPIHVEIDIFAPLDEIWHWTQTPGLHQQWDLRFTEIKESKEKPSGDGADPKSKRFDYATRIGLGLVVRGKGEYLEVKTQAGGERSSSLRFWSDSPFAIIREGSGYWRYQPLDQSLASSPDLPQPIRFTTGYNYQTRWGISGKVIDALFFRPLIGWATAWSFDALRKRLEDGTPPRTSFGIATAYGISRLAIAFTFAWHGLVPKLIAMDAGEVAMLQASGLQGDALYTAMAAAGVAELIAACIVLFFWRKAWPLWLSIAGMIIALIHVSVMAPSYLDDAFTPVTLNLLVIASAICALMLRPITPSARRCRRVPRSKEDAREDLTTT